MYRVILVAFVFVGAVAILAHPAEMNLFEKVYYGKMHRLLERGTCRAPDDADVWVCVSDQEGRDRPMLLKAGESTRNDQDCEGILTADGGAFKIYGWTGITIKKDKNFVAKNWQACVAVPGR